MDGSDTEGAGPTAEAVAEVFGGAAIAYVGVVTARGSHVTPQVVSPAAGRLWFVTTERSVKVRAVRARADVTLTAWKAGSPRAMTVEAEAHVLDLAHPTELTDDVLETLLGPVGLASYAISNVKEVMETIWQAGTGRLTSLADRRVLVSCRPDRVRVLDPGPGADAVLGWDTPLGPLAVPGAWDEVASRFAVAPDGWQVLDEQPPSAVAVAVDRSTGTGAADRAGALFRGRGQLIHPEVGVDVERVTTWSGGSSETVDAGVFRGRQG